MPIKVEKASYACCLVNFVHDQFACGRRFRILNIVDNVTCEWLAAIPDHSISQRRVARELGTIIERRGKPGVIILDHGTKFPSSAMPTFAEQNRSAWHHIAPGKPMLNGFRESFNSRMRRELINRGALLWVGSCARSIAAWLLDYNARRACLALGYRTPAAYASQLTATCKRR